MTAGSGWAGVRRSVPAGGVRWPPGGAEMLPVAAGRDTESPGEGPAEGFRAAEPAQACGLGHVVACVEERLGGFQAHLLDELLRCGVRLRREEPAEVARAHVRDRGERCQRVLGPRVGVPGSRPRRVRPGPRCGAPPRRRRTGHRPAQGPHRRSVTREALSALLGSPAADCLERDLASLLRQGTPSGDHEPRRPPPPDSRHGRRAPRGRQLYLCRQRSR
jgi:hypothetical protein